MQNSEPISCNRNIEKFLGIIRNFESNNKEALPQRSNFLYRDSDYQNRNTNASFYSRYKDKFVEDELCLEPESIHAGLYFFFNKKNKNNPFFYIGKAKNLYKRITKHFITFDYFFYTAAFPKNYEMYYSDCLKFYVNGEYEKKHKLLKRQFEAFRISPFEEIGWISAMEFNDSTVLKLTENHAIYFYKPLANGTGGSMAGNTKSLNMFNKIQNIINGWLVNTKR